MILPQGKAFNALNERIKNIEMLIMMESKTSNLNSKFEKYTSSKKTKCLTSEEVNYFIEEFAKVNEIKL